MKLFHSIFLVLVFLISPVLLSAGSSHAHLEVIERYSKPDTRGSIWYDGTDVFLAGHGSGLWTIGKCGTNPHYPSDDKGLWDLWVEDNYIYGVGEKGGFYIYDKSKDNQVIGQVDTLDGIGVYVIGNYAYAIYGTEKIDDDGVANDVKKTGLSIIDIASKTNPTRVGEKAFERTAFSQIRGNSLNGDGSAYGPGSHLYATTVDGKLIRFTVKANGALEKKSGDDLRIFGDDEHKIEGRKLFVDSKGNTDTIYVNSLRGELAIVTATDGEKMTKVGSWSSITDHGDDHGQGSRWPASGGVFVTDFQQKSGNKKFALITAADGNGKGALYWLDVTDPSAITLVDDFCDSGKDGCEGNADYGFNNIWINGYEVYMGAHDGYVILGLFGLDIDLRKQEPDGSFSGEGIGIIDLDYVEVAEGTSKEYTIKVVNYNDKYDLNAKLTSTQPAAGWKYTFTRLSDGTDITDAIESPSGYISEMLSPDEFFWSS